MLPTRWGGTAARSVSLFALLATLSCFAVGCKNAVPPLVSTRGYVRLEALLPLHPAWAQVQALDAAQARFPAAQVQASSLKYPLTPLPEVFTPPVTVPPSLAAERDRRVQEDSLHYVQQTEQALTAKNIDIMKRFEQQEQRQTESIYSRALAERELTLSLANEQEAKALAARIDTLGFRLVTLRIQVDAYTSRLNQDPRNPVVQDALRQEALVSEQMNALEEERKTVADRKVRPVAEEQLAARRRQWQEESAVRLKSRKMELADSVQQQVEQARTRLKNAIKPMPSLANALPPTVDPQATPLPLPVAPDAPVAIGHAQAQLSAAMVQEQRAWQAQKQALLTAIRADTAQAVAQIARKEGWDLLPAGSAGKDLTTQAAGIVRAQWRQRAVSLR